MKGTYVYVGNSDQLFSSGFGVFRADLVVDFEFKLH
jgi:hypothetical protein